MNWKLSLIVFFVLLTACQTTSPTLNLPSDIPVDISFNKEIEVRVLDQTNDQFGLLINILIFNRTTAEVWFPDDFGVSIYQLNDSKEWEKIENTLKYNSNNLTDGLFIQPYRDMFDAGTYMVSPAISHETQEQPMRIVVVGHKVVLGEITDEIIGAYVDVYVE